MYGHALDLLRKHVLLAHDHDDNPRDHVRSMKFQDLYNAAARRFNWKYTTNDLNDLLTRIAAYERDPALTPAVTPDEFTGRTTNLGLSLTVDQALVHVG
jgi:hypothetical protein